MRYERACQGALVGLFAFALLLIPASWAASAERERETRKETGRTYEDLSTADAVRRNREARSDARDQQRDYLAQADRAFKRKQYERAADLYTAAAKMTYRYLRRRGSKYVEEERELRSSYGRTAARRLAEVERILEAPTRAFKQAEGLVKRGRLATAYAQYRKLARVEAPARFREEYVPQCIERMKERGPPRRISMRCARRWSPSARRSVISARTNVSTRSTAKSSGIPR